MIKQTTLKSSIRATGLGIHSGAKVYLNLRPAAVDSGIVFRRVDLDPVVEIPADAFLVKETVLSTNIFKDDIKVATIEHLMSAFAAMGIDNAIVELNAEEVPIMDGSAAPFIFLLKAAGIKQQHSPKKYIKIVREVSFVHEGKKATFKPYQGCKLSVEIDFDHPAFMGKNMKCELELSSENFIKQVSRARTFGFMSDIEYLRANNLARGGSMENAIVVDEKNILNGDGLRFEDEFSKHKVLDAVGDIYLLGMNMIGEFVGYKTGHFMNNQLVRKLLSTPDAFEIVHCPENNLAVA
ncbi:MAG: UDP-3-O-acyl-N-acetylglucosamine deacetylase [Pseudomonadales bacterium]|nr:UDP-3-O-acyl-N-acetylglucosamine deacetylase [Pseudomonadales bacterium]NRA16361.1 UDP-3-O-acyl-N-acetylglucosamine deacetylase [Oceanospirillaceae bacterium]